MATNKVYTDKNLERHEEAEFHNIITFKESYVTVIEKYIKKSTIVLVEGTINTKELTETDGSKRVIKEVLLEDIQFHNCNTQEQTLWKLTN